VIYWLEIPSVVPSLVPVYWDQSDGPSTYYNSALGFFNSSSYACNGLCTGSESFQLIGESSSVLDPGTGTMVLLGGALLMALVRARRRRTPLPLASLGT
jgi:hypothetical protein